MKLSQTQSTFDPKTFAKTTADEIIKAAEDQNDNENMLAALQEHYNTLHTNQQMYIDYLTEFVERLKTVQKSDKESFTKLKKEVIKHVLDSEKKQATSERV